MALAQALRLELVNSSLRLSKCCNGSQPIEIVAGQGHCAHFTGGYNGESNPLSEA